MMIGTTNPGISDQLRYILPPYTGAVGMLRGRCMMSLVNKGTSLREMVPIKIATVCWKKVHQTYKMCCQSKARAF
jgi:hypothetical protein